jgi:hypothetical protein
LYQDKKMKWGLGQSPEFNKLNSNYLLFFDFCHVVKSTFVKNIKHKNKVFAQDSCSFSKTLNNIGFFYAPRNSHPVLRTPYPAPGTRTP